MKRGLGFEFQRGERCFPYPRVDRLWDPFSLIPGVVLTGIKRPRDEADHCFTCLNGVVIQ
jgi:hypothetical protein